MKVHAYPVAYSVALGVCALTLIVNGLAYLSRPPSVSSTIDLLIPVGSALLVAGWHRILVLATYRSAKQVACLEAEAALHRALLDRIQSGEGSVTISSGGTVQ